MGRIYDEIQINGDRLYALFDSGAVRSYVTRAAARRLKLRPVRLASPYEIAIGGKSHRLKQRITMDGRLDRNPITLMTFVLDTLGTDEDGRPIDMVVGATAMEEYNIKLDLRARRLDLSRYRREFVEYSESVVSPH